MNVLLEAPLSKKKLVQSKLARGEKKEEIKPVPVRCVDGAECRNNGVGAECGKSCYQSRGREKYVTNAMRTTKYYHRRRAKTYRYYHTLSARKIGYPLLAQKRKRNVIGAMRG